MNDILDWAKRKRQEVYTQMKIDSNNQFLKDDYKYWNLVIDKFMRYDALIERTELLHKLECLEPFNNSDVPKWVKNVIKGPQLDF